MSLGHRKLAVWYQQLARQLEAGLRFSDALRSSQGTGLPAAGLEAMAQRVDAGGSVEAAFEAARRWLPLADRLVLSAAAEAGRMPSTLKNLAARHAQLGATKLRLALACLYPLAMLHAILLLVPVMRMIDWERGFNWDSIAYARTLAGTLGSLWAALGLLWWMMRRSHPVLALVARIVPFISRYVRAQGLADFAFALGNFLDAGMIISRAWSTAGSIATRPELSRAAQAMQATISRGERPGTQLSRWPCFPPDFVALYRTGESTGQLEQSLFHLASQYQENAHRALTLATFFYPALLFLGAAAAVIYHIITFYSGYLRLIEKLAS
jgi:general secretion pathway protein F/type IV pilus assembly protein PilC